ncbi:MAG TPA: hypothetical protein VFD01_09795 [Candidatus Dormibacteraeota bacterium]|jgi:hypothetical protein|nr:hypothetical protein [Candidatus Dormibacteraeota bacterium]
MPEFTLDSRIVDVLRLGERGRRLLYEHGYHLGNGFVDVLSQYQSLREAARFGHLRDVEALVRRLNEGNGGVAPSPEGASIPGGG